MLERNQHYTDLCELTNNPEAAIHCKGRLCWQEHQLSWEKTGYKEWTIATKLEKNSSDFSAAVKLWQIFSCLILICLVSCCFIFGLILELKQVPCLSANAFCKAGVGSVSRCAVCAARDTKGALERKTHTGADLLGHVFSLSWHSFPLASSAGCEQLTRNWAKVQPWTVGLLSR